MARCQFPGPSIARSFKKIMNKSSCDSKAKYTIVFRGKNIQVCGVHRQYHNRDRIM